MIYPVILCGGSGERLWPLSRKSYPKQFTSVLGGETLFQSTALRLRGLGDRVEINAPLIVTLSDFRFVVTEQLAGVGIDPGAVLIEPEVRNTAPAILAAALQILESDPDGIMLVAPSDHRIENPEGFASAVAVALRAARIGEIVTFGIEPSHPETGYGYLEPNQDIKIKGPSRVRRFVEKPDLVTAEHMLRQGNYLWNSGIFMFRASAIIQAFKDNVPEIFELVQEAHNTAAIDLGFLRLAPEPWSEIEPLSIDHAVMEKATNLCVVPMDVGWSDLGDWHSVWKMSDMDSDGVATQGPATGIACRNSLLRSESENIELVGLGLENIVAIATGDAVLVADMRCAQQTRRAVEVLRQRNAPQATDASRVHRPWGWFESLVVGNGFRVKRIYIKPGAALSLQRHLYRSEHWVVVEGTAKVTLEHESGFVSANQSIYIPMGAKHRLANPGSEPVVLIEVQSGSYVGEDDIIRFEDRYARA